MQNEINKNVKIFSEHENCHHLWWMMLEIKREGGSGWKKQKSRFTFWIILIFDIFSFKQWKKSEKRIYKIKCSLAASTTTTNNFALISYFLAIINLYAQMLFHKIVISHSFDMTNHTQKWGVYEKWLLPGSVVDVVVGAMVVSSANIDLTLNDMMEMAILKRNNGKLLSFIVGGFFISHLIFVFFFFHFILYFYELYADYCLLFIYSLFTALFLLYP